MSEPQRTLAVAVAVVHGIGMQKPDFAAKFQEKLTRQFAQELKREALDLASAILIKPIHWAPALQDLEDELWRRLKQSSDLHHIKLRKFLVDFAADAFAYQPIPQDRTIYDSIHAIFAEVLRSLAAEAGGKAPLCVVAHSLGSVIASNYFYDLQKGTDRILEPVRNQMGGTPPFDRLRTGPFDSPSTAPFDRLRTELRTGLRTPLERGETFSHFYTLGSPIAIWSLRYADFGVPITVPSPKLSEHHPHLEGEWVNFYDKDDVCGFPLKTLNRQYEERVKADVRVNVGGLLTSWNPASHLGYWEDDDVVRPIAKALAQAWRLVNRGQI
jgi:hypothetical protein